MTERFSEFAKGQMGAIEELIKGLPGVKGYVDKELRRDADKRVRMMIAAELEQDKQQLFDLQKKLLKRGGLQWLDDVDGAIQKLQILIDRVKTASYGYAGFFDAVRIRENQLDALHRFDVGMAQQVAGIKGAIETLAAAEQGDDLAAALDGLTNALAELNRLFDKRHEAIVAPDLLLDTSYAPDLDPDTVG